MQAGTLRKDRLAVIDVGSNSVRMVVYPTTALAAPPLFNEKAMCGLGREQAPGGALAAGAMQQAIDTTEVYECTVVC